MARAVSEHRRSWQAIACAALAAATLLVLGTRAFRGVDLTDESFHAALAYRFLLGDVPFRDELALHQTAVLLTLPGVWLSLIHHLYSFRKRDPQYRAGGRAPAPVSARCTRQ
jgi:hypothetical protein